MYNDRFQYLRDKYISPNNKQNLEDKPGKENKPDKSLEEYRLQEQIKIAQKIKQLNEIFLKKSISPDYVECLEIIKQLEILLLKI